MGYVIAATMLLLTAATFVNFLLLDAARRRELSAEREAAGESPG